MENNTFWRPQGTALDLGDGCERMRYPGDVVHGRRSGNGWVLSTDLGTWDGRLLLDKWFILLDHNLGFSACKSYVVLA